MRLVIRQAEHELYGPDDLALVLGHQNGALAAGRRLADPVPVFERPDYRKGMHEADRRAAVDAIDQ